MDINSLFYLYIGKETVYITSSQITNIGQILFD